MWERGEWRVRGGGQMSMVTLYNRVWFGTEVWDEYGYDILRHTGYCRVCVVVLGVKRCEVEGTFYDIKGQ